MTSIICCVILLAALIYSSIAYNNLKQANGSLEKIERRKDEAQTELQQIKRNTAEAESQLAELKAAVQESNQKVFDAQLELIGLSGQRDELIESFDIAHKQVLAQKELLDSYNETYATNLRLHDERCQKAQKEADDKVALIEQECANLIFEKRMNAQLIVDQLQEEAENERAKYLSIIEVIANAQTNEERDANRHIKIREAAQDDISYLLNNVVNHLSNPDVLYKLIWSEYVQKLTNEMLDYVLPNGDCAGIYKITNDRNKKAYIGRSTSVRKRLTDHVKSAVGISTIANQRIHDVMREEGLWNFTFELIEECDKDKLNEREKYYINFFQSADNIYGYNQKAGG